MDKKLHYILSFGLFLSLAISSCKKEDEAGSAPEIALQGMTKTTVEEFKDSVFAVIEYYDEQGDIGDENPDVNSLEMWDERYENPEQYRLPPVTPNGEKLRVRGTIRVYIPTLIRRSTEEDQEQTYLHFRLKDRAGNWSNTVRSPLMTITPRQN
ncbi:hypothetical protein [Luteibaculum oceani]|uniref:Uncharacterized protein n=1 Tax=Luteibaculum oceani TaxID=1294296 RepID=A0A5C6VBL5_9FLAO|nr:hypothetical protein [Luteibaculum oceani]TXC82041.1 hypothetical protein FRX97_02815 [Luteibaculum oceani]